MRCRCRCLGWAASPTQCRARGLQRGYRWARALVVKARCEPAACPGASTPDTGGKPLPATPASSPPLRPHCLPAAGSLPVIAGCRARRRSGELDDGDQPALEWKEPGQYRRQHPRGDEGGCAWIRAYCPEGFGEARIAGIGVARQGGGRGGAQSGRSAEPNRIVATRQVKNSYSLRVALLADVFTRVIPLPLPPKSDTEEAEGCIWAAPGVRHETQTALLHALGLAARHLACACLSVRATRALDAARCVAFACIAAMADAAVRIVAEDFPSQVTHSAVSVAKKNWGGEGGGGMDGRFQQGARSRLRSILLCGALLTVVCGEEECVPVDRQ